MGKNGKNVTPQGKRTKKEKGLPVIKG